MAEPRSRAQQRSTPAAGAPSGRKIVLDPARAAALDVLKAVRVDDAYTNLVLPAVLRKHGLERTRRGVRHRAGVGHDPAARHVRRDAGRLRRPAAGKVEAKVLDALRLGTHQLLSMRVPDHAAISTTVDLVRARVGPAPAGFVNAVLRSVSERDLAAWVEQVAPDERSRRRGSPRSPTATRAGSSRSCAGRSARDELDALLAADNEPPRVTLVARPGTLDPRGAARRADAVLAVRRGAGRRRPRRGAGGRRGTRRRPGRGLAAGRAGAGRAPVEGRTSAGWTCAPARAARRRCWPRSPPSAGAGLVASERQPHRAGLVRRTLAAAAAAGVPAWSPPTAPRRRPRRHLRPGAGRRALLGPGRAAAASRGALAAQARRPARAGAAPAPAGPRGARPGAARGRGALRDLLAGARRDRRGGHARCWAPARRRARGPRPRCCRRAPLGRAACPAPSSCGRTGTAPTRCSWRCSAAVLTERGG